MKNEKELLIDLFYAIKDLGFVRSRRKNNTGIGKTFEDYMGVVENNSEEPDLFNYEIKSHREDSDSFITLFTKNPDFPKGANAYLKDRFGTPYEENPTLNRLHTSIFVDRKNSHKEEYSFELINDKENEIIRIGVYDYNTGKLLDNSVGYYYETLEKVLHRKLKNLFYVSAQREYRRNAEYFYFYEAEIYTNPSFERFLDLLNNRYIMFDIRIGSYQSGQNYGKAHDHGSGFRIREKDLSLLYEYQEVIS